MLYSNTYYIDRNLGLKPILSCYMMLIFPFNYPVKGITYLKFWTTSQGYFRQFSMVMARAHRDRRRSFVRKRRAVGQHDMEVPLFGASLTDGLINQLIPSGKLTVGHMLSPFVTFITLSDWRVVWSFFFGSRWMSWLVLSHSCLQPGV